MKTTLALLLTTSIASANLVLLKFDAMPSPTTLAALKATQPVADSQAIDTWFANGECGFVLDETNSAAIDMAVKDGAKMKTLCDRPLWGRHGILKDTTK